MSKIIAMIMGENCQDTIGMCLESVKEADEIIYLDGGSKDTTPDILKHFMETHRLNIIGNPFNKEDPEAISKQRNFYLNFLKENCNDDDWILVLDADEVLDTDGIRKIRKIMKEKFLYGIFSPQMMHLMYTLGFADNTKDIHFVPSRLFKLGCAEEYPKGEHCILNNMHGAELPEVNIWHLGYLGGAYDVKKRFDQQALRNNGHAPKFLSDWNKTHLMGNYPIRKINIDALPDHVLKNFGINPEEFYFENRGDIEAKHGIFVKQWNEFFKPESVYDFGCGRGLYLYFWEMVTDATGYEFSKYARTNKICKCPVYEYDLNIPNLISIKADLATALDVLEHLEYETLDIAINTLIEASKQYILTSIPYKGTYNCDADKTHIIKEDREWWKDKFVAKGLKEIAVPDDWIFKEQLMIFEK